VLVQRLADALGPGAVKTEPEDLSVYAFDAYTQGRMPKAVVLPASTIDVAAAVKIANEFGEPIVARGAGTGLCGGAIPAQGGIVFSFARMNRILELDAPNRRAHVQPGLVNLKLSEQTAHAGLFYAPDPSSQKASTIGGNIGTNAGGPHCLSYGTTVNHVLGLEIVDENGDVLHTSVEETGYDLTGALVGSEGTLGIVCSAWVRLLRAPESVRVWLAGFPDVETASEAVSAISGLPCRISHRRRSRAARGKCGIRRRSESVRARDRAHRARCRRDVVARGAIASGARRALGGPERRPRRHGARCAELLYPGRRRAAHQIAASARRR
jgi:glycolate oxidase